VPNEVLSSVLRLTGATRPGGTRLIVDLRILPLEEIGAPEKNAPPVDTTIDAEIPTLTILDRYRRVSCKIPVGSSLAISLGSDELQGQAAAASSQARGETSPLAKERLFLITPRKIVLESEEEPVAVPPKKPAVDIPTR
jgi:hypothetical protein